jgi:hypothetical protein
MNIQTNQDEPSRDPCSHFFAKRQYAEKTHENLAGLAFWRIRTVPRCD